MTRIERVSDGERFFFPISSLDPNSQALVKAHAVRPPTPVSSNATASNSASILLDGWKRLKLDYPRTGRGAVIYGFSSGSGDAVMQNLPVPSWLYSTVKSNRRFHEHFVEFEGEADHWELTDDDRFLIFNKIK